MGYRLTIGNAKILYVKEDNTLELEVEETENENAPNFCNITGKGNVRSPSYTVWENFCRRAGLYELFYGYEKDGEFNTYQSCSENFHRESPLLFNHPGIAAISEKDLQCIRSARIYREQTNGGRLPGFSEDDQTEPDSPDAILARLIWLEFWFDWAIKNCKYPAISNS